MLKMSGVKLEKLSDINVYLFIEKGLRGGISYIAERYSKKNSKYIKNYDPKKPSKFITHLDMNNLVDGFDVDSVSENSPIGYILEVDLEYPNELHVFHRDYPLAQEKLAIHYDMLLGYCKKIADEYEIKVGDVKKLIPNLGNKTNYVFHYRNLQLYLSLGIKLTKIHRVLIFKQSDWMKKIYRFKH